jgi:hypothetical protein
MEASRVAGSAGWVLPITTKEMTIKSVESILQQSDFEYGEIASSLHMTAPHGGGHP